MMISGYHIEQTIFESNRTLIYRARRETDDRPVILKCLRQEYPPPQEIARFKLEYEITRRLHLPGVINVYSLDRSGNSLVISMEDFGGEALSKIEKPLPLADFLPLALRITTALGQVHQEHVIHKDINPSNIIHNPATGQLKLIDFGIATVLSRETPLIRTPNVIEGTLAYISPEQTGRMNRVVDYRTDFYSLGVTFYELLTGRLPFETVDALELVHSHIAKQPPSPHRLDPAVPEAVSGLVMKLLAKTAELRYQSAYGLKADLESCLAQLQRQGAVGTVVLGRRDYSDRFQIPQKLYGRDREIAALLAAFERIAGTQPGRDAEAPESGGAEEPDRGEAGEPAKPEFELVLVTGYAGVGKTALVNEIHKPIVRERGYFARGKFDRFQRDIPYSALLQALRGLIQQLLTESRDRIALWKEKLLAALGPNAQVVVDVIPDLELIVGRQPAVPELGPAEAQNRFNLVFQRFIGVFTQEHPLVIFLDDLQWADLASLQLIHSLATQADAHQLLLIASYRDNEVEPGHPLLLSLDQIEQAGTVIRRLALSSLGLADVNRLIADTLGCAPEKSKPLAELALQKTEGNPFFLNQFLLSLHEEGLLTFAPPAVENGQGGWQWDVAAIERRGMTDNVIELMIGKIHKLSAQTQHLLQLAACIGNPFDLKTLAIVEATNGAGSAFDRRSPVLTAASRAEPSPSETAANLWEAVQEGLIQPVGGAYRLWSGSNRVEPLLTGAEAESLAVSYRFLHDRVHQAAYSLLSDSRKEEIHLAAGLTLLETLTEAGQAERLFDIVHHLNLGRPLITRSQEKYRLARLNLLAGQKAKTAAAYQPALRYLAAGLELLAPTETAWQEQYDLSLALHTEAAQAAYLNGDFTRMEALAEQVMAQARTTLDQVKIYEIRIQAAIARHKMLEAVETARRVLALLAVTLPEEPGPADIGAGFAATQTALAGRSIAALKALPEMTDPAKLAAMRILTNATAPVYYAAPQMFPLLAFNMVRLSLAYGNCAFSTYGYSVYGVLLCAAFGDIPAGYQFGRLGLDLLDRFETAELKAKVFMVYYNSVKIWQDPLRESLPFFIEGYKSGLETGDVEYAAFNILTYGIYAFMAGRELASVEQEMAAYGRVIQKLNQELHLHAHRLFRQIVLNLMDRAETVTRLAGESYDEAAMLPRLIEANDITTLCRVYLYKAILGYLFDEPAQAVENIAAAEPYLQSLLGTPYVPEFHFYHSLILLKRFPDVSEPEQAQTIETVTANQALLKNWAAHAPANYGHKYALVEAERARVEGRRAEAMDHYEQAIAAARENDYLNDEALAHELAAKFYLAGGPEKVGQVYLFEARYAYLRWGAAAKVAALDETYPRLLSPAAAPSSTGSTSPAPAGQAVTSTSTGARARLDFETIIKAAQAISEEIELDRLLTKLMKIVIENAGAQKGYLILQKNDAWSVEASGAVRHDDVAVLQSIPLAVAGYGRTPILSAAVINYVRRMRRHVVLDDAAHEGEFMRDPYIAATQPKSILCMPLLHQGELSGILYLENNLTSGAFTPDQVEIMSLLGGQAAISITNAQAIAARAEQERLQIQTEAIYQAARLLNVSDNLPDLFQAIVDGVAAALPAYAVALVILDRPKETIAHFVKGGQGAGQVAPISYRELQEGLSGWVLREFEPALSPKGKPDSRESAIAQDRRLRQGLGAIIVTPVHHREVILGTMTAMNRRDQPDFTRSDLELMQAISVQAAVAIENANLYADLQASEKKYRRLFEDSKDTIFITTPAGKIVDISPACFNLFGYTRAEMLTRKAQDFYVDPAVRRKFRTKMEQEGMVRDFEVQLKHRDGSIKDCLFTATLRRADDGTVWLEGVVRDITAQKQAEQERLRLTAIERELSLAENIQRSLLPAARPPWAGRPAQEHFGLNGPPAPDVICYNAPAREIGGDLYAYHTFVKPTLNQGWYAVTVGDVTGKGMPAALLMAVSLASFRSIVGHGLSPAGLLNHMSGSLLDYTGRTGQNCALVYAEITPPLSPHRPGRLRVANAGCIPPLIRRAGGAVEWVEVGGLPLGIELGLQMGYEDQALDLNRGDTVILTSDGVIEANNAAGRMFGFDRLEQVVAAGPRDGAAAMLAHLRAEVTRFVGSTEPHDDLTIVVVRV